MKCLNKYTYAGFSDWRLPNRKELFSLIDRSQYSPALPVNYPFINLGAGSPYATSTTYASDTSFAWVVDIWNVGVVGAYSKGGDMRVWPVRGGGGISTLSVTKAGTGSGAVTSNPSGISCGDTCSATYKSVTIVTLAASPDVGSVFAGWSGGGCSGTKVCSVSMKSDLTVKATFNTAVYTLNASVQGGGSLSATGLTCKSTSCKGTYPYNTLVTITATPNSGESFLSWTGCDGVGGNVCTVQMVSNRAISASFTGNACTYTVSPTEKSFTSNGGSVNATVSATGANSCYSPAVSVDEDWITAGLVSFKQNRGTVKVSAPKNTTIFSRVGVVSIGNKTLDVTQAGVPCSLTKVSPPNSSFDSTGGNGEFAVVATTDCEWKAEVDGGSTSWLAIESGNIGTGNGSVTFTVLENTTQKNRTGKISVYLTGTPTKKKMFSVSQKK